MCTLPGHAWWRLARDSHKRSFEPLPVWCAHLADLSACSRERVKCAPFAVFQSGSLRTGSGDVDKATGMHLPRRREPFLSETPQSEATRLPRLRFAFDTLSLPGALFTSS